MESRPPTESTLHDPVLRFRTDPQIVQAEQGGHSPVRSLVSWFCNRPGVGMGKRFPARTLGGLRALIRSVRTLAGTAFPGNETDSVTPVPSSPLSHFFPTPSCPDWRKPGRSPTVLSDRTCVMNAKPAAPPPSWDFGPSRFSLLAQGRQHSESGVGSRQQAAVLHLPINRGLNGCAGI